MTKTFRRSLLGLLIIGIFSPSYVYADTFEFISFTPPAGWTRQNTNDGLVYKRATGVGAISFYASYPTSGGAADEFEKIWKARLGAIVPGGAPRPKLDRDGEYAVAIGGQQVNAQDAIVSFSLVTFVGKGRALGVVTLTAGDEVAGEVTTFLNTVAIGAGTTPAPNSKGEFDLEYNTPVGYLSKREGGRIVLTPITVNEQTPCVYGISPSRASRGNLEMDARDALLEPLPGWQVKGDRFTGMRGKSADGWQYLWLRTDVELPGANYQYLSAMSMAVEIDSARVGIVWGFGNPARCQLDDISFARLFHSLRPRAWVSDGGKSIGKDLVGTWRNSQNVGMAQYEFLANGSYKYGIGTITRLGIFETTASSASDGRWELHGSDLIITPNVRDRASMKYRVRIYEEFVTGRWTRAMSLLDEAARPALEVQYMRVEN